MAEKHAIFLESLTRFAKTKPEFTPALKCIAKCYIVNEGLMDGVKSFYHKAKDFVTADPAKEDIQQPAASVQKLSDTDRRLLAEDRSTFSQDFQGFKTHLNELLTYIRKYGDNELVQFVMSPEFKRAEKRGRYIDNISRNAPRTESLETANAFIDSMYSMMGMLPQYEGIIKETLKSYIAVESTLGDPVTTVIDPTWTTLTEMVHTADWENEKKVDTNRLYSETLPGITAFIFKHGYYAWDAFTKSTAYRTAKQAAETVRKQ